MNNTLPKCPPGSIYVITYCLHYEGFVSAYVYSAAETATKRFNDLVAKQSPASTVAATLVKQGDDVIAQDESWVSDYEYDASGPVLTKNR
jgi:hypothetical protein